MHSPSLRIVLCALVLQRVTFSTPKTVGLRIASVVGATGARLLAMIVVSDSEGEAEGVGCVAASSNDLAPQESFDLEGELRHVMDDVGPELPPDAVGELGPRGDGPAFDAASLDRLFDLGHQVQPKPKAKLEKRSFELMRHARAQKSQNEHKRKIAKLQETIHTQGSALQRVSQVFPDAARGVGIKAQTRRRTGSEAMPMERAAALIKAATSSACESKPSMKGVGVKPQRLWAFTAGLLEELQGRGLIELLLVCRAFRRQSSAENSCEVHLHYTHESDATAQGIGQQLIQRLGRPSRQKLSTEVMHQQGMLRGLVRMVSANGEVFETTFAQVWLVPSMVMLGKTSGFVHRALCRGMPFAIGEEEWQRWASLLRQSCDSFSLTQVGDKGSTNLPAFRHFATSVTSEIPAAILDITTCELHSVQNIKTAVPDLKGYIGRLYSLSKIIRVANFFSDLINVVEFSASRVVRIVGPPPEGKDSAALRRLVELLFDMGAVFHKRDNEMSSVLFQDLEALCNIPVFFAEAGDGSQQVPLVHYCWSSASSSPCCSGHDEMVEKLSVAQINFQLSTAFDTVAMSRFTHLGKCRKRLLMGMAHGRLFMTALQTTARKRVPIDDVASMQVAPALSQHAAEIGAGASDHQETHRARCGRLAQWLGEPQTQYLLPIAEICESILDKLQYVFFGHEGRSISTAELCDPDSSPIGLALECYWSLLDFWAPTTTGPWALLFLVGWQDFEDQQVRTLARREVLACAAGVFQRFDCKFASMPANLHKLVSVKVSATEKAELRELVINSQPCCRPLFVQSLLRRFPSGEGLASEQAQAVLRLADMGRLFTTKLSELGHAEERVDLASNGPGKSFVHHARRDMIRRARVVHIAGGGEDPCEAARSKRRTKVTADRLGVLAKPTFPSLPAGVRGEAEKLATDFSLAPLQVLAAVADSSLAAAAPQPALEEASGSAADMPPPKVRRGIAGAIAPSGSGGSVYLTFLNHSRKSRRLAKGRRLTQEEQQEIVRDCRSEWASMPTKAREAYEKKYQATVRRRKQQGETPASSQPSDNAGSNFNVGDRKSMIKPKHFCAAFHQRGFPSDSAVFGDGSFCVRRPECLDTSDLLGGNLDSSCCATKLRNVCKAGLRAEGGEELVRRQEALHRWLGRLMDSFGKAECNNAEILLMFAPVDGPARREFVLVVKATMQPKSQILCSCEWGGAFSEPAVTEPLQYPFDVRLALGSGRVCPQKHAPAFLTSDEFATSLARKATSWSAHRCTYQLPATEDLRTMRVAASGELAGFAASAAPRRKAEVNDALDDLYALMGHTQPARAGRTAAPRGGVHGRTTLGIEQEGAWEQLVGADNPDCEAVLDEEAQMIALGDTDSNLDSSDASQDQGQDAESDDAEEHRDGPEKPVVYTCTAPDDLIEGPSASGYYYHKELGRSIIRQTAAFTNASVGVKCYQHGAKCTLAMAAWKVPPPSALKAWALHCRPSVPGDSRATIDALCKEHLAELRRLRDAAVWRPPAP